MSDWIFELEGTMSLADIESAIANAEAGALEFVRSVLSYHENRFTNLATFKRLPAGTLPAAGLVLVKHGQALPAGKAAVWSGVMLVSGSNMAVTACR